MGGINKELHEAYVIDLNQVAAITIETKLPQHRSGRIKV